MFCTSCGQAYNVGQNFCGNCGQPITTPQQDPAAASSPAGPFPPSFQDLFGPKDKAVHQGPKPSALPNFREFMMARDNEMKSFKKTKAAERMSQLGINKKKAKVPVKINVGLVHFAQGELKIKRTSLIPVSVARTASDITVKRLALQKHQAHNKNLPTSKEWKLLYPDMQEVRHVPGTTAFFTVEKYKQSLGKPYQRINLYLARIEDQQAADGQEMESDDEDKTLESSQEVVFNIGNWEETREPQPEPQTIEPVPKLQASATTGSIEHEDVMPYDVYCGLFECDEGVEDDLLMQDLFPDPQAWCPDDDQSLDRSKLESVMRPIYNEISDKADQQQVTVRRRHVWADALRAFSKTDFKVGQLLTLTFIGEEAADLGGPRREFFRLLMKSLTSEAGVLIGSEKRKTFTCNPLLLLKEVYFQAGKMVATTLMQGGPGLNCLSPAIYGYILGHVDLLDVEDISDPKVQEKVRKLKTLPDDSFQNGVAEECDVLINASITKLSWKVGEREILIRLLCEHHVINKNKAAIDQFVEGLKVANSAFFPILKENSHLFKNVFCYTDKVLSLNEFRGLFRVCLAPEGANIREGEEVTTLWWEEFIQDSRTPLPQLLEFVTGASEAPPLGFDKMIDIKFFDKESVTRRLPHASTCSLQLFLPRSVENYSEFEALMHQALCNACGFGKI